MSVQQLTKEADELIRKVVSRYNQMYSHSGSYSQVELDLMLEDLRHLYEKFRLISDENLASGNRQQVIVERKAEPEKKESMPKPDNSVPAAHSAPQMASPKPESVPPSGDKPFTNPAEPQTNISKTVTPHVENSFQEVTEHTSSSQPEKPQTQPVSQTAKPPASEMIADRFKAIGKSISDTVADNGPESSIGEKLKHQKLTDLKSAIGLYEKFNIINELFDGDQLAYEQSIVYLNSCTSLVEAEHYLAGLRSKYNWPSESETLSRLQELLERKFL